jgi:hypothetical protein
MVDHGNSQLREAIHWSGSSLSTLTVGYIRSRLPFTQTLIDSHLIVCCFLLLLLPDLHILFKCGSWLIFSVATIAVSRWTHMCLRRCCVSLSGALRDAPVVRLDSARIAPEGSVMGAMACCCRNVRNMITKRSGKCLRLYNELQVKMESVTANLHIQFKLNPAAYSSRGLQRSRDLSKLVQCCLFVYSDTLRWTTGDISCLIDINRTFFKRKDVCWCLSQDIAVILQEPHANYQVIIYY